jgi:TPR repeat protein
MKQPQLRDQLPRVLCLLAGLVLPWDHAALAQSYNSASSITARRSADEARAASARMEMDRIRAQQESALNAQRSAELDRQRANAARSSGSERGGGSSAPSPTYSNANRGGDGTSSSYSPIPYAEWIRKADEAMRANRDRDAAEHLRKAADLGSADAAYLLGAFYAEGLGVAKDPAAAVAWYRKAAAMGNKESLLRLGSAYYAGRGVPKDLSQSIEWYTKASQSESTRERALQRIPLIKEEDRLDKEIAALEKCRDTGACEDAKRYGTAAVQQPVEPDPFAGIKRIAAKRNPANAQARANLESKLRTVPLMSDEAISLLKQISELDPKDDLALYALADRYRAMGRWPEAIEVRRRALASKDFTPDEKGVFWSAQCMDLIKVSRPQEAVAACQAAMMQEKPSSWSQLEWDKSRANQQFFLASAQAAAGNRSAALAAYEKAVTLDSGMSLYSVELNKYRASIAPKAAVENVTGRGEPAASTTASNGGVAVASPGSAASRAAAASAESAPSIPSTQAKANQKSADDRYWEVSDLYHEGLKFVLDGNPRAARPSLRKAVELEPTNHLYREMFVVVLSQSGDVDEARANCETLISQQPKIYSHFDPQGEKGYTCKFVPSPGTR